MIYFIIIFSFILLTFIIQSIVGFVVRELNEIVINNARVYFQEHKHNNKLRKELEVTGVLCKDDVTLRQNFITRIIGIIELFIFSSFSYMLIISKQGLEHCFVSITTVILGWIALKIFGNYQQWKGPYLGRASYYVFLIGSLLNILLSISLGMLLAFIYSNWRLRNG